MLYPLDLGFAQPLALRRNKGGRGGNGSNGGGSDEGHENGGAAEFDGPPPTPKWIIAAVALGVLLLFGGLFIALTSGGDPEEPTITGDSAPIVLVEPAS